MDIYSLKKLEEIYIELLEKGASFHLMKDLKRTKRGIILRHDLDTEMDSALPVAQMEHGLGIKSSYFFLVTSRFYNLYCDHCRKILHEILSLGHEVGLHFDASIYPEERLEEAFGEERHILEVILKQKIYSLSSMFAFKANVDQIINAAKHNIVQILFHPAQYCIRNEKEPPGVIYMRKIEIERFGNALIELIVAHPLFAEEIRRYPKSYLDIKIKLKD